MGRPLELSIMDLLSVILSRIQAYRRVTDAVLLATAMDRGGQFATLGSPVWGGSQSDDVGNSRRRPTLNLQQTGGGFSYYAEIEGTVVRVDAVANTFEVRVLEGEYLRGRLSGNPVTVRYGAVEFVESWLSPCDYIEVEGSYDPVSNDLTAYQVELEDSGDDDRYDDDWDDDDGDGHDDDRDDDDGDGHDDHDYDLYGSTHLIVHHDLNP